MNTAIAASTWLANLSSSLSPKAYRQFERALNTTSCRMLDEVIFPFACGLHGALAFADDKKRSRDHDLAYDWAQAHGAGIAAEIPVHTQQFFTNALKPVSANDPLYRKPSERVVLNGPVTFTFEFDMKDMGFFEQQCAWLRMKGKKSTDCPMGDLFEACSQFVDFIGITVVWSGNKSFHIHVMFNSRLLLARSIPMMTVTDPRPGMAAHWQKLKKIVMATLQPTCNGQVVEPDKALENPDNYRRLPLGTRTDAGSFFGMPAGTKVPQLVMWEEFRPRAAPGATALFFSEPEFMAVAGQAKATGNRVRSVSAAKALPTIFTNEKIEFFECCMRETFPDTGWPRFARFEYTGGTWRALFLNHEADNNAASVMTAGFAGVKIEGSNPHGLKDGWPRLPQTLAESFDIWAKRFDVELNPAYDPFEDGLFDDPDMPWTSTETVPLEKGHVVGQSEIEQQFAAEALSRATIATATRRAFATAINASTTGRIFAKGPEGAGKTTELMKMLPRMLEKLKKFKRPHRAMLAFTDYVSAREKCEAFNRIQADTHTNFIGIVIPSFSKLYDDTLADMGLSAQKITAAQAARDNFVSLWKAIEKRQPDVLKEMARFCTELHASCHPWEPVYFTVHPVAEQWKDTTMSRLMWGKRFWSEYFQGTDTKTRNDHAMDDTRLAFLIHDEVTAGQIVDLQPAEVVEWVRKLVHNEPKVWKTGSTSLADTWDSFDRFAGQHLPPTDRSTGQSLTFETAREIFHRGVEQWTELTLTEAGAYPENNADQRFYTRCVAEDHKWVVKPTLWWQGANFADYVVILTTEMLPTACIERADPDTWTVLSLETDAARDTVDVYLGQQVNAKNMADTCVDYAKVIAGPKWQSVMVVSDSVKGKVVNSRTHVSARGSNSYIGAHVLQTMPFMHPDQHEELLALNAYTNRDDCVALYHMDRFNQTAGRNVGFRKKGDASHTLVTNRRLYEYLLSTNGWYFSRYDLVVHLDARQRRHLTAKK